MYLPTSSTLIGTIFFFWALLTPFRGFTVQVAGGTPNVM